MGGKWVGVQHPRKIENSTVSEMQFRAFDQEEFGQKKFIRNMNP